MADLRLIAAAVVVALTAAACGQPDSGFDIRSLESSIPAGIVPDDPAIVTDVSCPELATSEATTILCTASIAERPVEVTAAISTDGTVQVSSESVLLDLAGVAAEAGRRLSADLGVESVVECPGSVVVSVAGDTFGCVATDPTGTTHDLVVSVVDESGNWTIDLLN